MQYSRILKYQNLRNTFCLVHLSILHTFSIFIRDHLAIILNVTEGLMMDSNSTNLINSGILYKQRNSYKYTKFSDCIPKNQQIWTA